MLSDVVVKQFFVASGTRADGGCRLRREHHYCGITWGMYSLRAACLVSVGLARPRSHEHPVLADGLVAAADGDERRVIK